ncbi:unnamed protein product [Phyllotreta striolata]|uniref:THAP-type domain-containing protein n=1 Tax=Phyllotreta striolata TaxID=444603 RepID=A0A9N9T969_PHYSR|nr:unnamed protein product [Phyllotreta striolata]
MPGFYCACRFCTSKSGQGISLFTFPKDQERAKIWIEACNRQDLLPKIQDVHKNYRLCENHFKEKQFSRSGTTRKTLLPDAIPTEFLNFPPAIPENHEKSRKPPKKFIILSDPVVVPVTETTDKCLALGQLIVPEKEAVVFDKYVEYNMGKYTKHVYRMDTSLNLKEIPINDEDLINEKNKPDVNLNQNVESLCESPTIFSNDTDTIPKLEEEEIHIKDETTTAEQETEETVINNENIDYLSQYQLFLTENNYGNNEKALENNYVNNENAPKSEKDFPSLDFFMEELVKHNLNYRKEFVGQCLKALDIRFKEDHLIDNNVYLANVPVLPQHLKQINQHFYVKNTTPINTTDTSITEISPTQAAIEETITEIGIYYGSINVTPTFKDILEKVQSRHEDINDEVLKDWLNKLKVNFKTNEQKQTRSSTKCKNNTAIPTLDYFFKNLEKSQISCSVKSLKKWLDLLHVQYELTNFNKQARKSKELEQLTSEIVKYIFQIEKKFYTSLNKKVTQISTEEVNRILKTQQQKKCRKNLQNTNNDQNKKTQHQNDIEETQEQNYDESPTIKRPRIETNNYSTNIDNEIIIINTEIVINPTFDYFYNKFRRNVCCKHMFKSWLDFLNIKYTLEYHIRQCKRRRKRIPATIMKNLIKFDQDSSKSKQTSQSLLLQLLEDIDEQFLDKDEAPTLEFIDKHVQSSEHFKSNTWYSISKLEKWLNALNIKFTKEQSLKEEEIPNFFVYQKPLPTLDYFHEKMIENKKKCYKSTLKDWLEFLTIKFESTYVPKKYVSEKKLFSSIVNILVDAEKDFYEKQTVSMISLRYLKNVENEFKNKKDVPTLDDYCNGIHRSNFFKSCTQVYTKPQIQWLLNKFKFNVKICKDKEDKKLPNLDYFYEKLLYLKADVCPKETLAHWLKLSNIQFEEHNIPIDDIHKKPIPSNFYNTLFKLSNIAKTYNLECVIKQLETDNISSNTPMSLRELHSRVQAHDCDITIWKLREFLDVIGFDYKERSFCKSREKIPNETTNVQQTSNVDTSIKKTEVEAFIMDSKTEEPSVQSQSESNSSVQSHPFSLPKENEVTEINKDVPESSIPGPSAIGRTQAPEYLLINELTRPDTVASSGPDEVMKCLTDTEYIFFKSKKVPTLDDFYKNVEIMYGNKYSKDQTSMWLIYANIKFKDTYNTNEFNYN